MPHQITELLIEWSHGSKDALEKLLPLVERELHRIAANYMRHESPGHSLQTTELVNEAYLKIVNQKEVQWQNRAHFFAIASQTMRRILVDHARSQRRAKRGGKAVRVNLDDVEILAPGQSEAVILLDELLQRLAAQDPRASRIVEMKFFAGLTAKEIAEVLKISESTVNNDWDFARAWLQRQMSEAQEQGHRE